MAASWEERLQGASEPTEVWLQAANERYRAADMLPKQRPWEAWRDYAVEFHAALELRHPIVQRIFAWFGAQTQPGAMAMGSMFEAPYYFDASFWPVSIPVAFGTVEMSLWPSLYTMPAGLKYAVSQDPRALEELVLAWTSATDCAFSFNDLMKPQVTGFAADLLSSGFRELASAAALLLSERPSAKAAHTSALAAELFGKWLLAVKAGLTEREAQRTYSHDLEMIVGACAAYLPVAEGARCLTKVQALPQIADRYRAAGPPRRTLWDAYLTAQTLAAALMRVETGRDTFIALNWVGTRAS